MSSKCFITFLNPTTQTERSGSNPRLQPRCFRSSHASFLRRKVARQVPQVSPLLRDMGVTGVPFPICRSEREESVPRSRNGDETWGTRQCPHFEKLDTWNTRPPAHPSATLR